MRRERDRRVGRGGCRRCGRRRCGRRWGRRGCGRRGRVSRGRVTGRNRGRGEAPERGTDRRVAVVAEVGRWRDGRCSDENHTGDDARDGEWGDDERAPTEETAADRTFDHVERQGREREGGGDADPVEGQRRRARCASGRARPGRASATGRGRRRCRRASGAGEPRAPGAAASAPGATAAAISTATATANTANPPRYMAALLSGTTANAATQAMAAATPTAWSVAALTPAGRVRAGSRPRCRRRRPPAGVGATRPRAGRRSAARERACRCRSRPARGRPGRRGSP